jgi:Domain of unknown function (DUF4303)
MNSTVKLLEQRLFECAKPAFTKIMAKFSNEGIYSLALYTSGGLEYLTTSCSTYKGLEQVAQKYKEDKYYASESLQQLTDSLKWSPCDSPHHLAFDSEIDVNDLMWQLSERSYELYSNGEENASSALSEEITEAIVRVLQKLDADGIFGTGALREGIVVNLLKGDQSDEERLFFAKRLNPPSVFKWYNAQLTA